MFGLVGAAKYFSRLLQVDPRHIQPFRSPRLEIVVVVHPAAQQAQPVTTIANRPALLLDYALRPYGTVIPQSLYTAFQPNNNAPLNMPIFFVHQRGTLGLPLIETAAGRGGLALNGSAPSPGNHSTRTCIRINVSVSLYVAHRACNLTIIISPFYHSGLATRNGAK
jgi:hypothetical protein